MSTNHKAVNGKLILHPVGHRDLIEGLVALAKRLEKLEDPDIEDLILFERETQKLLEEHGISDIKVELAPDIFSKEGPTFNFKYREVKLEH